MTTIISATTHDVRFPTGKHGHGSDAMNKDPDYSAAYLILETDQEGLSGHSLVFTIGRGNDLQCESIAQLAEAVIGENIEGLVDRIGDIGRDLVRDSQMRWLGPEKGIPHMAAGGVINALWDLVCKVEQKPLWQVLAHLSPEQLTNLIDFRYLTDALTPEEALHIFQEMEPHRAENERILLEKGLPAYTTTPGWLGYTDETMVRLAHEAIADGFTLIKMKVGGSLDNDRHRMKLMRETVGPDITLAIDANQVWDVPDAIAWIKGLEDDKIHWVEEPTSPDDILGHKAIQDGIAPIKVATGEHVHNRIMVKQLLQSGAISFLQIDATRVAGVNENIAMIAMAKKFGVPVCPHAGGVGLCEMVQHLAMFDSVAVSGHHDGRVVEFVDHLHEHFVIPTVIDKGRYIAPTTPGAGAEMKAESIRDFDYQTGKEWHA
ncbi:enolase-like protein [Pontimonas salivibrio]|uniref:L-fuconate dehydratase n=1 Tax=Pontimonas salivibrio TaxID=1159327 RepID=A0A2L2BRM3_9MICO|nr:enolase C-terminal domain-like protein [Pontimonas salivibrio]AVG24308.1 enolase-like protein [Pontimonas salivibrio]